MKKLIFVLALSAFVFGCAPDDQMFNISALTDRHQTIFVEAMLDLNERYPDRASFAVGEDANSVAVYGRPLPGKRATAFYPFFTGLMGWRIIFLSWVSAMPEEPLLSLTTHELCHVIGIGHDNGNPDPGHC